MVKRFRLPLLVCAILTALSTSRGEDVRATARVDSNRILIGDWITLHIELQQLPNIQVQWPVIADSLEGLEIIRRDTPVVKTNGESVLQTCTFVLTAFDSGTKVIPPLVFKYRTPGDTTVKFAETSPIPVFVRGIAIDTSKEIRDIKAPLRVPISFADVLPYLIGLVLLGLVIWLIVYIRRRLARGEPIIPEAPQRPAHEVALEALHSLEAEHVWQRGKVKEYYSSLTDIVRTYIERRFSVIAMEMTSDEILASKPIRSLPNEIVPRLRDLLLRADLVKFAKYQPAPGDNETGMQEAVEFVEQTYQEPARDVPQAVPETVTVE